VRARWTLLACIGIAAVAILGLLLAGSQTVAVRSFVLRTPNMEPVAQLHSGQRVCEGPVTSPQPIQAVGVWGGSVIGLSRLRIDVSDASTGGPLASGRIAATAPGEYAARLDTTVPSAQQLRICVVGELNTFSLEGSPAQQPDVVMTGPNRGLEFSLVLLNNQRSLLGSLSTAFPRASLWHPSWVGSWTFWLLAIALLGSFGAGVVAVVSAASADEDDGDRPVVGEPGLQVRSDPGQDRPQPVR
jgi:hypothetical protein